MNHKKKQLMKNVYSEGEVILLEDCQPTGKSSYMFFWLSFNVGRNMEDVLERRRAAWAAFVALGDRSPSGGPRS